MYLGVRENKEVNTMDIGTKVTTEYGGRVMNGTIIGAHGSADYYAVRLENGETIYRWGADLEERKGE